MKHYKFFILITVSVLLFSSCAKVFYSPDAYVLAEKQKIVAIVPPKVLIDNRWSFASVNLRKQQEESSSLSFQNGMYSWILKRKMQGKIMQEFQDISITNAKLKKAGYPEKVFSAEELCELLGVDGIITSNFLLRKPISEAEAMVTEVFTGEKSITNEVNATLTINDCGSKKMIWNYNIKLSSESGQSVSTLIDWVMRKSSKKMPYVKK